MVNSSYSIDCSEQQQQHTTTKKNLCSFVCAMSGHTMCQWIHVTVLLVQLYVSIE